MILKKLATKSIRFYQLFISPMLGSNCRYYPTCSEYAIIEFETDNFFKAFFKSFIRILRCNQLFIGGIEYPVVRRKFQTEYGKKIKVKYWFVKKESDKFYVVKAEYE